jgi:hypothetical protein
MEDLKAGGDLDGLTARVATKYHAVARGEVTAAAGASHVEMYASNSAQERMQRGSRDPVV